jgi:hypothetical protein
LNSIRKSQCVYFMFYDPGQENLIVIRNAFSRYDKKNVRLFYGS